MKLQFIVLLLTKYTCSRSVIMYPAKPSKNPTEQAIDLKYGLPLQLYIKLDTILKSVLHMLIC